MMIITANDVKKQGASLFAKLLEHDDELIISVKGKQKYVVMDIDSYQQMRQDSLDLAYLNVMQDIKAGHSQQQTADEHIQAIMDVL